MGRTIISCFLGIFFSIFVSAQDDESDSVIIIPYDATCLAYLNELKLTCLSKDTARLHELIGENAFGWSCYGGELPSRNFASDWLIFKNHFSLMNDPEASPFWELMLRISENGFYYDGILYTLPAFHTWGMGYMYDSPFKTVEYYNYVFLSNMVTLYSLPDLNKGAQTQLKPTFSYDSYPYRFTLPKEGFQACYKGDEFLGYVRKEDVIYWNFHFSFVKENEKWELYYYEVCD